MQIPNLPTDNLYKFIALSGVLILITILVTLNLSNSKLLEEIDNIETEEAELEFEIALKDFRIELLGDEIKELREQVDKYKKKGYIQSDVDINNLLKRLEDSDEREYYQFLYDNEEKILPEILTLNAIEVKNSELFKLQNELQFKKLQVNRKKELFEKKNQQLTEDKWKYYLGIIISSIVSIFGFVLWYIKVQKYLDKKLKDEITKPNNLE